MGRTLVKTQLEGIKFSEKRKVGHNTVWYKVGDKEFWKLHNTNIIIKNTVTGEWTLNSGGWKTVTTKDRLNTYGPVRVYSNKGLWLIRTQEGKEYPYHDGMVLLPDGTPKDLASLEVKQSEDKKLLGDIAKYCNALKKHISSQGLPTPDRGDCFYCQMRETKTGLPLGEVSKNTEHLLSHLEEKYFPGSLVYRAMEIRGYGNLDFVFSLAKANPNDYGTQIVRNVRQYLKKSLGV